MACPHKLYLCGIGNEPACPHRSFDWWKRGLTAETKGMLMTEAEWESCADPPTLLKLVRLHKKRRKRRLFCAACCRRIWHLFKEQASRDAIEQLEQEETVFPSRLSQAASHAPTEATDDPENLWEPPSVNNRNWEWEPNASTFADAAARFAARLRVVDASDTAASAEAIEVALACVAARGEITGNAVQLAAGATWKAIWEDASAAAENQRSRASYLGALRAAKRAVGREQVGMFKDLFGNPFRQVQVERSWLLWNDGVVSNIARTILEQRRFDLLPILADALEEAGCTDAAILGHCRHPGPHIHGCWVLDRILGKVRSRRFPGR